MSEKKDVRFTFKPADEENIIVWPCTILVPQDGGSHQAQILDARFKVLPQGRTTEIYLEVQPGAGDLAVVKEALVGFSELLKKGGGSVEDALAKDALLKEPYVVDGLLRGYFDMIGRRLAKN